MESEQPLQDRAQAVLGHRFSDPGLLQAALTHPSVAGPVNYQRLEFLGDRVLGLVIAAWLYESFPQEPEGKLNRRFSALVRREALAEVAGETGLDGLIRLEAGAESEGARKLPAVLADVCEAVIGALYLDAGLAAAEAFVTAHWAARLKAGPAVYKDAKTTLQEWAQGRRLPLPAYRVAERRGPDHSPEFVVAVSVEGVGEAQAAGTSKRLAEQAAAAAMLERLLPGGEAGQ